MERPPNKSTAREIVEAAVEGGVGMVPIAGSPIAVAFAVAMGWTHNRRMQAWLDDLATAVDDLQHQMDEPLSFEELADNDTFVDAVIAGTRAAQATHQQEKLEALRNGVLNSIGPSAPDLDQQARFFRFVEQFSASHLVMLNFLRDPVAWFDDRGLEKPDIMASGRAYILELGIPQFAGRRDWYDLIAGDIQSAGLGHPNLQSVMTGSGVWSSGLSALGRAFLAFIHDARKDVS